MEGKEPSIIFENDSLVAVDKPAGLVVHSDGRTEESTLTDWVLKRHPELTDIGGLHTLDSGRYVPRAGILHRLDRETSGVIMIAKNDETFYFVQRQFLDHSIEKVYNAFVMGTPEPSEGVIDKPIGRSRADFRQWTVGGEARGTLRPASTRYRVLSAGGEYAFLELTPKTGRTHQLRVHLLSIGHPILCDERYGTPTGLGFMRLALHAARLTLTLPGAERITIEAPLPADFQEALKKL